jgi:hypothetical protein
LEKLVDFLSLIHALVDISDKNYIAECAESFKYKYFIGSQMPNSTKMNTMTYEGLDFTYSTYPIQQ